MHLFSALPPLLLAAGTASAECTPVEGWDQVLADDNLRWIIVGEAHGTDEIPKLFADVVCLTARSRRVVVALEQPSSNQSAITDFINSDGGASARAAFLSAPMWNQHSKDGRSSEAMFRLFEDLRKMRAAGQIVSVVGFQPTVIPEGATRAEAEKAIAEFSQAKYEKDMAELVAGAAGPDTVVMVLTGSFHAMKEKLSGGPTFVGMAGHLPPEATLTLKTVSGGGESWSCRGQPVVCASHPYMDEAKGRSRGVHLGREDPAYSGVISLGSSITASPPQVKTSQEGENVR